MKDQWARREAMVTVKMYNRQFLLALVLGFALSACAGPNAGQEVNDPFEAQNRKIHNLNVAVDRVVVRNAL